MKYSKKISPKKYVKKSYSKAKPNKNLMKTIKKIIHQQSETKCAFTTVPMTSFNSGMNGSSDMLPLLPPVSQGVLDNQRVGDQIRAQTLTIKGHMYINSTPIIGISQNVYAVPTNSNSRIAVRMIVCQPKNISSSDLILTNPSWINSLIKRGGTTNAFTGSVADLYAPVNRDAVTVYHDKTFYLSLDPLVVAGTYPAGTLIPTTGTRQALKFFNFSLKCKNKLLKYDSNVGSGLAPVNYSPICLFGYAHLDGSAPDTFTTIVNAQADINFTYEDA